ncbi:MAG: choice-of-anchor tandem repeat GloVer-containing protein [Terriglobales bacterium]
MKWTSLCTASNVTVACVIAVLTAQSAQAQTYKVLHTFKFGEGGIGPYGGVILDAKGNLYGTTGGGGPSGNGTVFKLSRASKETVLYRFKTANDGSGPAGIIRDVEKSFYGNTYYGGTDNFGTVFELSQTGKETVLHSFMAEADGAYPQSPLSRTPTGICTELHSVTEPPAGARYSS